MSSFTLSANQKRLLRTLITLAQQGDGPVSGSKLADELDVTAGAVHNRMQHLTRTPLVESFAGPHGGYLPTAEAYHALGTSEVDDPAGTPVSRDGEQATDAVVTEMDFRNVHDPSESLVEVVLDAASPVISEGDVLTIGPTPGSNIVVRGRVEARYDDSKVVVLDVLDVGVAVDGLVSV